mmetsp:Transcript_38992/g.62477  ORF Transcript_38992/g.62477 Transcript_38992/m.62477 type:complete len:569 (+) Transcript_38992:221-1927(+)
MEAVTLNSICSKGFCGGMIEDLKRRSRWYWDDWTNEGIFSAKVTASIFFMFFTSIAPAITFSVLLEANTEENSSVQIGAVEVIFSTALTGVIFAIFGGQPLCILGVTGPVSIFSIAVFNVTQQLGIKFLPFYAWTQIWAALMHVVLAMTNMCDLIAWVTRYSCETFGCLIATIYLYTGARALGDRFYWDLEAALLSLILGIGTALVALFLSGAREWVVMRKFWRDLTSDYAATISILFFTAVPYMTNKIRRVDIDKLQVPDTFETTSGRSWFVDLGDISPGAAIGAIIPGFVLTVLFFFDHNVSSLLSQAPEFKLRKGSAFHWDFFVVGINILITGLLGIPPTNGLIPQAPLHTKSLSEVRFVGEGKGRREVVTHVHEQRVSNLLQAAMIGITLSPPLLGVLRLIPNATLDGLFLFMGAASFPGNQFAERVVLLVTEPELRESHNDFLTKVPWKSIENFTLIQLAFCAVIFGVTLTPAAMLFPLFIASLVFMRKSVYPQYYSRDYILALDSDGMPVLANEDKSDDEKAMEMGNVRAKGHTEEKGLGLTPISEAKSKNIDASNSSPLNS